MRAVGSPACGRDTLPRQRGLELWELRVKVLEAADAHVADAEDLALQRPLSPGDDGPVPLPKFLPEGVVVDARWISDGGHGVGREAAIRIESEPQCVDPGPRRLGEPASPRNSILKAFLLQQTQRLSEREEERDGGRVRCVLLRERV